MKLATTTAEFRYWCRTPAEEVRCFEGTGFRYLDLSLYMTAAAESPFTQPGEGWRRLIEEAGEAAARLGLTFCQTHLPDGAPYFDGSDRERIVTATRRCIEGCAVLGIRDLVIHLRSLPGYRREIFTEKNIEYLSRFLPQVEKNGQYLLIENTSTPRIPCYFPVTARELLDFIADLGHARVRCCWDTGHAHMSNLLQYDELMEMGTHLAGLHVNDNFGSEDLHMIPYFGNCNFDAVIRALLDTKYPGYFTLEGTNSIRTHDVWMHYRRPFILDGAPIERAFDPSLELKKGAVALSYQTGRYMLSRYDAFEP
jgi:L-ribulose-5-phosphate 3-epimerase